jgi:hypothetical protein
VLWSNDALRAERAAFLAAAIAAIAATLDVADLSDDPSSRSNGRLLTAVRELAELQRECLVAYDRLIQCCEEIGVDHKSLVALHQGRAELALRLQNALVDVEELVSDM